MGSWREMARGAVSGGCVFFWWLGEFPVPFEWKEGFWVAGGRWQGAWGRGFPLRGGGGFWKGFLKNRGWGVFHVRGVYKHVMSVIALPFIIP